MSKCSSKCRPARYPGTVVFGAISCFCWDELWVALRAHGVSDHLVWTMRNLYTGQLGQIQGDTGDARVFPITAGVGQGCVLNPRLFTPSPEWAMKNWRQRMENSACGIDLEDGDAKLLDLRFAE